MKAANSSLDSITIINLLAMLKNLISRAVRPRKMVFWHFPARQRVWIKRNESVPWVYAEKQDLLNVELVASIEALKPDERPPFLILDVREPSEREIIDLPSRNKDKVEIPRMFVSYDNLVKGYYPEHLPKDRHIVCVC